MFAFIAAKMTPSPPTTRVVLNSFQDFYRAIEKFKLQNPKLKFGFLHPDNIEALKYNASKYSRLNYFIPPGDRKVLGEVQTDKAAIEMNVAIDSALKKLCDLASKMSQTQGLQANEALIEIRYTGQKAKNLFHEIGQLPVYKNPLSQKELKAILESCEKLVLALRDNKQAEAQDALQTVQEIWSRINVKALGELVTKMRQTQGLQIYDDLIENLNASDNKKNLFYKIRQLPMNKNPEAQKELKAIQETWNRRKNYAFLGSQYVLDVSTWLDNFEKYLRMIDDEFLRNNNLKIRLYAQLMGVAGMKSYISELASQTAELIRIERLKICDAIISRLELVPKKHLIAAAENVAKNNEPVYDDVACETAKSLQKFGLKKTYVALLVEKARYSLNYELIREYMKYIVKYGSETHKTLFTQLLNKPDGEIAHMQTNEEPQPAPDRSPPALDNKLHMVKADSFDTLFPLIREAAKKTFTPERFSAYDDFYAYYIDHTKQLIEEDVLVNVDFDRISQQAYMDTLKFFINKYAINAFPQPHQAEARNDFIEIANKLSGSFPANGNFDCHVINEAKRRLADQQEGRIKTIIGQRAETIQHDDLRTQFKETSRQSIQAMPEWTSLDVKSIGKEVDKIKNFILRKDKLIRLLNQENKRVSTHTLFSFLMNSTQTREKCAALSLASDRIARVHNLSELDNEAKALLRDRRITQKRSIFSFFETQSTTTMHLLQYVREPNSIITANVSEAMRVFG